MHRAFSPLHLVNATSEMALRNVASSMAVWADTANQVIAFWSNAMGTVAGPTTPAATRHRTTPSWYRQPAAVGTFFPAQQPMVPSFAAFSPFTPFLQAMQRSTLANVMGPAAALVAPAMLPPAAMAPWQAWLKFWPQPPVMPAWPMAFALMATGMPQGAAWPTAQAGAHAFEASRKATEGFEQLFASYRTDGGHALAQIAWPGQRLH